MNVERQKVELLALLSILLTPPPPEHNDDDERNLLFLILQVVPPELPSIRTRLDLADAHVWRCNDVYSRFQRHPYEFFQTTGETPASFIEMLNSITPLVNEDAKRYSLNLPNRLIMTLLWLRSYPCYSLLSLIFDVSIATVGRVINRMWPILWEVYAVKVQWPNINEWTQMYGKWEKLPYAIAAIDGTSHYINRPEKNQELYYSGHRNAHCVHTQIIIDNNRRIRYIHSGFYGHMNDAQQYHHLPKIGPNENLQFPEQGFILADKIYPCIYPLLNRYSQAQIQAKPIHQRRRCRKFNKTLNSYRVYVEHIISNFKHYKVIGFMYRHPRWMLPSIVELCAGLTVRRIDLFQGV